jgi:hypothetical protein
MGNFKQKRDTIHVGAPGACLNVSDRVRGDKLKIHFMPNTFLSHVSRITRAYSVWKQQHCVRRGAVNAAITEIRKFLVRIAIVLLVRGHKLSY